MYIQHTDTFSPVAAGAKFELCLPPRPAGKLVIFPRPAQRPCRVDRQVREPRDSLRMVLLDPAKAAASVGGLGTARVRVTQPVKRKKRGKKRQKSPTYRGLTREPHIRHQPNVARSLVHTNTTQQHAWHCSLTCSARGLCREVCLARAEPTCRSAPSDPLDSSPTVFSDRKRPRQLLLCARCIM